MRYLILLSAALLAAISAFISVTGLSKIFVGVIVPFVALEFGKVVATLFLHANWKTAPKAIKLYLSSAICILLILTSAGIYGYLSNAAIGHTSSSQEQTEKITFVNTQITTLENRRKELLVEKAKLDGLVESLTKNDRTVTSGTTLYGRQKAQRQALDSDIASIDKNLSTLRLERSAIESSNRTLNNEIGPAIYLAKTFYGDASMNSIEGAIRIVIYLIVFTFDPLAIVLLIAAQHSFANRPKEELVTQIVEKRPRKRKTKPKKVLKPIIPTESVVVPVEETLVDVFNDDYPKQVIDGAEKMLVKKSTVIGF